MKTETALAVVGTATFLLLLYQAHLDGLENQRLRLECECYKRENQRLNAVREHQGRKNRERGKWLERTADLIASCLKAIRALA